MSELAGGVIAILVALALVHVYWALGGGRGHSSAVPEIGGRPAFRPSRGATIGVAGALLAMVFLVAAARGWVRTPMSSRALSVSLLALGLLFLARAIGDFRLMGFFKRTRGTRFAALDSLVYSPLCLLMAVTMLVLAL